MTAITNVQVVLRSEENHLGTANIQIDGVGWIDGFKILTRLDGAPWVAIPPCYRPANPGDSAWYSEPILAAYQAALDRKPQPRLFSPAAIGPGLQKAGFQHVHR